MASDASPVQTSATHLVQGRQAPQVAQVQQDTSGKSLPPGGRVAALASASSAQNTNDGDGIKANSGSALQSDSKSRSTSDPASKNETVSAGPTRATPVQQLVTQLNKTLNDSGRPDQYRVDPQSANMIQEVNPANGAVIGQFSADEFPALARSVGATGLLIDSLA